MKFALALGLILVSGLIFEAVAQTGSTKILRFEVDGQKIRKAYKIYFKVGGALVEAKRDAANAFRIPLELSRQEYLDVEIVVGKDKLYFYELHASKFDADWIVGIDNKPFSDEVAYLVDRETVKRLYYIHFVGGALETRRVVMDEGAEAGNPIARSKTKDKEKASERAQSMSTRISRVEIDGKAVKTEYKVFFRHDGKIIDAEETGTGFVMPEKLRGADQLTVIIRLGKYRMEFSGVDSSKFQEEWVVGIDNKPFSSENAYLLGSRRVKRAYYIVFKGGSLETRYVVAER